MDRQLEIGGDPNDKLSQAINLIVEMLNDGKSEWEKIQTEVGKTGQTLNNSETGFVKSKIGPGNLLNLQPLEFI